MIPAVKVYAYKCYFCGGHLRRKKKSVLSHSERCFSNPLRKACKTCNFFKRHHGSQEDPEVVFCEKDIDITQKLKFKCEQWGLKPSSAQAEAKGGVSE